MCWRNTADIVYHVDPNGNHDACMQAFDERGIYLFLYLDTFTTQIEQSNPQWNASQYAAFTKVIDAFAKYDNVAGFFMANEVKEFVIVLICRLSRILMARLPLLMLKLRFATRRRI